METNLDTSNTQPFNQTSPTESPSKSKSHKTLLATTIFTTILAIAGIATCVFFILDANQKSQQISNLETDLDNKNSRITELETELSNLSSTITGSINTEPESTTNNSEAIANEDSETVTISLGSKLDANEERTVFDIGKCSGDRSSGNPESDFHYYIKCPIITTNGEAIISYHSNDNILRLTLPNQ